MESNNELLAQLLEQAKTNKKALVSLKNTAVKCKQFELACRLREMEKEIFPESEEVKVAKEKGRVANLALRLVEIQTDDATAWLISETMEMHRKKKGKFSIHDAADLRVKKSEIFFDEDAA